MGRAQAGGLCPLHRDAGCDLELPGQRVPSNLSSQRRALPARPAGARSSSPCGSLPFRPPVRGLIGSRLLAGWHHPTHGCLGGPTLPWGLTLSAVTRSTHLMQRLSRYLNLGTEALAAFPSELEILVYAFHGLVEVLISFIRLQIHRAELIRSNANICFLCNQEACVNILSVECLQVLLENSV